MVAMSFNDVASVSSKGNDYRIRFYYMGKDGSKNVEHYNTWKFVFKCKRSVKKW